MVKWECRIPRIAHNWTVEEETGGEKQGSKEHGETAIFRGHSGGRSGKESYKMS